MTRRILNLLILVCCGALVSAMAFQIMPADIPAPSNPAKVNLELSGKAKRGKVITMQVRVDLTGVTAPGGIQSATLGSYVIPISFDRNSLEFVSASGGETAAFALGPLSVTNPQTANSTQLVTLVGSQTTSDSGVGAFGVANVSFRIIATKKGSTTVSVNGELAAPGLSLASPVRSGVTSEPYRIAAVGQSSTFKIK